MTLPFKYVAAKKLLNPRKHLVQLNSVGLHAGSAEATEPVVHHHVLDDGPIQSAMLNARPVLSQKLPKPVQARLPLTERNGDGR